MILTRFVRIQLLVFAVVSIVGVAYVGANYVGIPRLFGGGYRVVAKFSDSGGIFPNAEVTYRGVTVGRVMDLRLTDTGVAVVMRLNDDSRIPADALAEVHNRSSVGEQYVDLLPQSDGGPYLREGSVIPEGRTDIPLQITTVLMNTDDLVNSVGKDNLVTVIDELNKAFEGTGPDLQRLLDSGDALLKEADANLPATRKLIRDGETVLETQRETSAAIKAFSSHLASFSDQLRESDEDIRALLDEGTAASVQTTDLLEGVRPTLPILLSNLITTGQVTKMRLPALEQILVLYPFNVAGSFTVAPGDGTAHFGLSGNLNEPPACTEGYESTERTYPQNTAPKPAPKQAYCKEDEDRSIDVRGSRYAPPPLNLPDSGSGASAGSGGTSTFGGTNTGSATTESEGFSVAGYDPVTGRVMEGGAGSYHVGSTGGQKAMLGKDSWKWLLLGPLSR